MKPVKTDPTQPISKEARRRLKYFIEHPIELDKKAQAMLDRSLKEALKQKKKGFLVRTMEKIRSTRWLKKGKDGV